jgi:PAS domain S-box-containing protein
MKTHWLTPALKVTLAYGLAGLLWIGGSGYVAGWITGALVHFTSVYTLTGCLFVAVTSALLFWRLRRMFRVEAEARHKTEDTARALRESEERFRCLAEAISEVFWICDLNFTKMHYVSPAYERLWGRSCESLYQNPKNWADLVHPEDRDRVLATFWMDRGMKETAAEYRIIRPDGTERWVLDRAYPLRNGAGEPIGMAGIVKDITESKIAEEALRQREMLYHTVFESAGDAILILEQDRFIDCNQRALEMFRLTRDELTGLEPMALSPERQPDGFPSAERQRQVHAAALAGKPQLFQWSHRRRDGGEFVAEVGLRAFTLGSKTLLMAMVRDITERLEAEQQVSLLNQVYALISHINEAIVRISDRDTLLQETCRIAVEHGQFRLAWVGLVDPASGEVCPVAAAGHDEGYVEQVRASVEAGSQGRGPTGTAIREGRVIICADIAQDPKMALWREAALARGYHSCIALPLKAGRQVVGALVVYGAKPDIFTTFITESLIEVAEDLSFALQLCERNRQRELEQQQLRLQHSALEAAANAIMITDCHGVIHWVNDSFTRLTGYTRAEAIGQNPRLLKSGAQNREFYQGLWQTILAGSVWQGSMINKRKDGALYDEEITITPVRSQAGDITHFIAIKQDVTERRKLEQQFLRAQRMQSIGLLAGGVAHDLNNVLTPVLMALPLLRGPLEPRQRDHVLETLEQSVRRGANIVQQVLTFARGVEVQRALVQLRHLVREVAKISEETFPRDIRINTLLPTHLWPFLGDPTQIHQVVLNLAVNARDAMPEGGLLTFSAQNVELRERLQFMDFEIPPGRYVSLSVADTGTGISPKNLERVFEPFFTTKPAGKGTGLGLSTVLGIVKSHGGLVEVKTRMGEGSTFTVFLPAEPAQKEPAASAEVASPPKGGGETVLVVDDEAGILQVASSILRANGYRVVCARNGNEALAELAKPGQKIQAVISDIMMPSMDGLALTRALRQTYPGMPIIAMTGLMNPPGEEDRSSKLRDLGVRHFLRKPFETEELLILLQEALREV